MPDAQYDVVILGGGAAGLMCAAAAGKRGRRVLLLERNERVGSKILISGGGRCNFTNLGADARNYISKPAGPSVATRFCKSAFARYTPQDFIRLVERHGIAYHEKKLGQQFCDGSSKQIVEMLRAECEAASAEIRTGCCIEKPAHIIRSDAATVGDPSSPTIPDAEAERPPSRFRLQLSSGEVISSASLVIATGGLSFPNLGVSDFGYRVARHFGIEVVETRPGLVPLTFSPRNASTLDFSELSGLSLPVIVRTSSDKAVSFAESLLITHRGFSGPAILQISSFWREKDDLIFDLLPDTDAEAWITQNRTGGATAEQALSRIWPQRFARAWCRLHAPARPLAQLTAAERKSLIENLKAWRVPIGGTEGYAKAEVTLGGVATSELSSKTMESRKVPGLFFIGEVVDVTGWLGGYNFQWAWASANAAAQTA
ncbi:MAG TPA: NAD(P)/FAD-dependent oxidoreductase [Candidatus Methylacidiphilales bacterium]|nr:NAD(P)/FAD-dependent oxidoreductase [Candidatus Methylacidiphilales bacterium]